MSFKEHLKSVLLSYFVIVTLVDFAIFVLGIIFRPEEQFGYEAFLSPLIYGAIALVPMLLMYSKRELTVKQQIVREIFKLIAIEAALLVFGFGIDNFSIDNIVIIISFAAAVMVIFFMVHFIEWVLDVRVAKQLNSNLKEFQKKFSDISQK